MAKVEGVDAVQAALRAQAARGERVSVLVGYTQAYGIYVHENLEANHPVGQAKFLEEPARELADEMGAIVSKAMERGATLAQALLLAGLFLQRASQKLVPVDTGALKGSAFTRLEKE